MPAISSGKILVSGASGYIAAWVVKRLLEQGFAVRGTVRSQSKGDYLKKVFETYGGKFEYCIVEDIEKEGAFDAAVQGIDAVAHTASPFHLKADHPSELLGPAVKGTVGVLDSVHRHGTQVKRVVITSSTAAVVNPGTVYTGPLNEDHWNVASGRNVEAQGRDATNLDKYRASKALAENAAWQWMHEHKGAISWDLVVINPPFVFGPIIHDVPSPDKLNTSVNNFLQVLKGAKTDEELAQSAGCWVDVRDVADAHVKAIQVEAASGRRFIASAGPFTMQDMLDTLSSEEFSKSRKGVPGAGKSAKHPVVYNSNAAKTVLGIEFISLETSSREMAKQFGERNWY